MVGLVLPVDEQIREVRHEEAMTYQTPYILDEYLHSRPGPSRLEGIVREGPTHHIWVDVHVFTCMGLCEGMAL